MPVLEREEDVDQYAFGSAAMLQFAGDAAAKGDLWYSVLGEASAQFPDGKLVSPIESILIPLRRNNWIEHGLADVNPRQVSHSRPITRIADHAGQDAALWLGTYEGMQMMMGGHCRKVKLVVDTRSTTETKHVKEGWWQAEAVKVDAQYLHIDVNGFASPTSDGKLFKEKAFKNLVWYIVRALARGGHVLIVDEWANDSAVLLCGVLLCAGGIERHFAHLKRLRAHIDPIEYRGKIVGYDRWVDEKVGDVRELFLEFGVTFATKATLTWDEAVRAVVEKAAEDNRQFASCARRPG